MKQFVFAVWDSKAETYGTPMFFNTKAQAARAFETECNRLESTIYEYPADFTLFCIGEYETDTGMLLPLKTPTSLGTGVEFKRESLA